MTARTYTAADRLDEAGLRRWAQIALERREPDPAVRAQMRARRTHSTVAEMQAGHERGLSRLRAQMPAPAGEDAGFKDSRIVIPVLPEDDRPDYLVCALCVRTLRKRKGGRVLVRPPGTFACPCCARLPQSCPPEVLDEWLARPTHIKRAYLAAAHEVDPATYEAAPMHAETTEVYTDVDGLPLSAHTYSSMAAFVILGPNTYWRLRAERGDGVL